MTKDQLDNAALRNILEHYKDIVQTLSVLFPDEYLICLNSVLSESEEEHRLQGKPYPRRLTEEEMTEQRAKNLIDEVYVD